jgi:hypothetical protein
MEFYKIGRQPHGASYEPTIYEADGRSRRLVGFKDRDQIDNWIRRHKLRTPMLLHPDAGAAAR